MLKLLSIANLAVISHTQVEFGLGLNVLSGETGAGKSIILAALGLLLGERASLDMLRTGEAKAVVEGVFDIEGNTPLLALLTNAGIEAEGGDLIIKREVQANGRGKIFVNNQAGTLQLLKAIQPHIIDVHGQGEQQSLLSSGTQTNLLDAFAGNDARRREIEDLYEQVISLSRELNESRRTESERLQLLDLIRYQISEIEGVNPLPDEDAELETERRLLVNAEKLALLCSEITRFLYDDDAAAVGKIGLAQRRMEDLALLDAQFDAHNDQLSTAKYMLEDIAFAVRDFAEKVTFSPARLQVLEDRLVSLDRLKRKYGGSLAAVHQHLAKMREKLNDLQHNEDREKALLVRIEDALGHYTKAAEKLTAQRESAAKDLAAKLKKDLSDVSLEKALFKINFSPAAENGALSQLIPQLAGDFRRVALSRVGSEIVDFYFSANKGEDARLLQSVASGGELSRLMLILKTNIAPSPYPRTLVFDEIDAGIGGRVAEAVGLRLKRLAASNQVICVTHQAQIARYADAHLHVAKSIKGQRTETGVTRLSAQERVIELARMIAGANLTEVTLEHARELLRGEVRSGVKK